MPHQDITPDGAFMERVEEAAFKEYTGLGRKSLPVLYRGRAWQMLDQGERFLLVDIHGFHGEDPDVIPCLPDQMEALLKKRRQFSIDKSDIAGVRITGAYEDYFTLVGVDMVLRRRKGSDVYLRLLGGINQFVLRQFLSGVGGEVELAESGQSLKAHRRLYGGHAGPYRALMTFLNRRCARVNVLLWLLSVISYALTVFGAVADGAYRLAMMGIGAVLPLCVFLLYLKHHRMLFFLSPGRHADKERVSRKRAGFYPKFAIPMLAVVVTAIFRGSIVTDVPLFIGIGAALAVLMLAALLLAVRECRRPIVIAACVLMFTVYAFPAVDFINAAVPVRDIRTYTAMAERKTVPGGTLSSQETYIGITMKNGGETELPLGVGEWNYAVIPGETKVTVREYKGLLGIDCADVEL